MLFRSFVVSLTVESKNTDGVLARLVKTVSDMKLSIEAMTARSIDREHRGVVSLSLRVTSPEQLELVINRIKAISGVDKVYRTMN